MRALVCLLLAATAGLPAEPLLDRYCRACHTGATLGGGLRVDGVKPVIADEQDTWARLLRRVESGEMPPQGAPRPPASELAAFTKRIAAELDRLAPPALKARRLNRTEYNTTVRDLLGVDFAPAAHFPADDSAFGFDNIADALTVSPLLLERQLAAAERIARAAVFGLSMKPATQRYEVPIPRRMEITNPVKIEVPAFFTMQDCDATGLSQPGAYHRTHHFPVEGDYVFRITGSGNRPAGSEPGELVFYVDGKPVQRFPVEEVMMSGFERRPDLWEMRTRLTAGTHDIAAAFPRMFEGLPPRFRGPNPSKRPEPPVEDPDKTFKPPPPGTPPHKIEARRLGLIRAREQFRNPRFEGLAVMEVEISGPHNARRGPTPESLARVFVCREQTSACREQILRTLAERALRRPATVKDLARLTALAERGATFEEGIALAVQALLVSPDFLFRVEPPTKHGLASRMSYFLWSTMPDDELRRAADPNSLVKHMLADARSSALVENFAGQWLETRRLESVQPDRDRFPDFDDYLRWSMGRETELFSANLIREDRSVLDLIDAPYTVLNERLARHYGIAGVTGTHFRRVEWKDTEHHRGGLLSHASILTASSYATRTSPVLRGKWILENILNAPPPPPPPDVPALDDQNLGAATSLRAQLERHRTKPVCACCHDRLDPLGFSLENYDAVGAFRSHEGKFPIDSAGALPGGKSVNGLAGLRALLREDRNAFATGLAEKLMIYALGRGLRRADQAAVRQVAARAAQADYRFSAFIEAIVESEPFQP